MAHEGDHDHADHPGHFHDRERPRRRDFRARAFTVGIGGPVGSGKTALLLALCRALRDHLSDVANRYTFVADSVIPGSCGTLFNREPVQMRSIAPVHSGPTI